ncbi:MULTISPECIES: hypothetical protein [unclassified Pseudomonas]|uniref:hypothetical protein n=1 Tax=unclassified Pseudomonas TaxID=196821 RepID=UPI001B32FFFB|nr:MULTISPECIES: hypothetical protein [unclassified Pseudomonas]MBP5947345.1 hypothetical protein [Pseudomonas sp. P9(2020)]MBZ9565498.1 hypothetical protein [Pseudomonas sp. P116]
MEFLRFLAFVAAWGFMWRWVVKNRGSWNIFYGNIVGAAGGFIVAMVVLSITLSLFPSSHDYETVQTQEAEPTSLLPEAESVTPPAALKDAPVFAAIEPDDKPSPADSALLPNYASRAPKSMAVQTVLDQSDDQGRKALAALSKKFRSDAQADKSMLAYVMCSPYVTGTLRFPASARFADSKTLVSHRFKDQVYTFSNTVIARNMTGDDITYRFDCSLQELPRVDATPPEWRLLGLKLQKADS